MKALILACFVLLASSGPVYPRYPAETADDLKGLNFNQVMEVIGGFFTGMSIDLNSTTIAPCVTNSEAFGGAIEKAVIDFSKHTFDGTMEGFMDLSNAFGALPGFVDECVPAAVETGKVIEKMVLAFAHPLSLIYHVGLNIIINGQEIFAEISYAMADYKAGNWYGFGLNIGKASFKVVYIPSSTLEGPKPEELPLLFSGFFSNFPGGQNSLKDCGSFPDVSNQLTEAMNLIFQHEFISIKAGLTLIGQSMQQIAPTVETCISSEVATYIISVSDTLIEPYSFAVPKMKDIVINGRGIGREVKISLINFAMKDWSSYGYYLGKAVLNMN